MFLWGLRETLHELLHQHRDSLVRLLDAGTCDLERGICFLERGAHIDEGGFGLQMAGFCAFGCFSGHLYGFAEKGRNRAARLSLLGASYCSLRVRLAVAVRRKRIRY